MTTSSRFYVRAGCAAFLVGTAFAPTASTSAADGPASGQASGQASGHASGQAASAARVVVGSQPSALAVYRLTQENFEGTKVAPATIAVCDAVVSSAGDGQCYDVDVLVPGITVRASGDGGVAVGRAGWSGLASTAVLANGFVDSTVIGFAVPADTVGFELSSYSGATTTCAVTVAYDDGTAATSFDHPCPSLPASSYLSLEADRRIASVTVSGSGSEVVDDLRFGLRPPNRLQVGRAVNRPATGTALLPVRTPGNGTTTLSGADVVRTAVDTTQPRLVQLAVVAKGAAKRTLLQRGRVLVKAVLHYAPVGGKASSTVVRVQLVRRR